MSSAQQEPALEVQADRAGDFAHRGKAMAFEARTAIGKLLVFDHQHRARSQESDARASIILIFDVWQPGLIDAGAPISAIFQSIDSFRALPDA